MVSGLVVDPRGWLAAAAILAIFAGVLILLMGVGLIVGGVLWKKTIS
jgi:hypothetical protein